MLVIDQLEDSNPWPLKYISPFLSIKIITEGSFFKNVDVGVFALTTFKTPYNIFSRGVGDFYKTDFMNVCYIYKRSCSRKV